MYGALKRAGRSELDDRRAQAGRRLHEVGDPEIADLRHSDREVGAAEKHIRRFQVAMDERPRSEAVQLLQSLPRLEAGGEVGRCVSGFTT